MSTAKPVNTRTVTGRRTVSYDTYNDLLADARQLAEGNVHTLGNWTLGQILWHLGVGVDSTIDGAPFPVPAPVRLIGRTFFKSRFLNKTLKPGFKFPAAARAKLEPPPDVTIEEGLAALQRAVERTKSESHRAPHPLLGDLTPREHEKFQLRHAEMHMSFVQPVR